MNPDEIKKLDNKRPMETSGSSPDNKISRVDQGTQESEDFDKLSKSQRDKIQFNATIRTRDTMNEILNYFKEVSSKMEAFSVEIGELRAENAALKDRLSAIENGGTVPSSAPNIELELSRLRMSDMMAAGDPAEIKLREEKEPNIVIYGLAELESPEREAEKIREIFIAANADPSVISQSFRMPETKTPNTQLPRPLKVKTNNSDEKQKVLRAQKKVIPQFDEFNGRAKFIRDDLTPHQRRTNSKLVQLRNLLNEADPTGPQYSVFQGRLVPKRSQNLTGAG